jgi:hypothetical protein
VSDDTVSDDVVSDASVTTVAGPTRRDERALDRATASALRAVAGAPPAGDVDWWSLRRRIVADAAPWLNAPGALASRRARGGTRPWWEYAAAWVRPALSVGAAVSVLSAIVAGPPTRTAEGAVVQDAAVVAAPVVDTADGALWLHAVRAGTGRATRVSDAGSVDALVTSALASAQ